MKIQSNPSVNNNKTAFGNFLVVKINTPNELSTRYITYALSKIKNHTTNKLTCYQKPIQSISKFDKNFGAKLYDAKRTVFINDVSCKQNALLTKIAKILQKSGHEVETVKGGLFDSYRDSLSYPRWKYPNLEKYAGTTHLDRIEI